MSKRNRSCISADNQLKLETFTTGESRLRVSRDSEAWLSRVSFGYKFIYSLHVDFGENPAVLLSQDICRMCLFAWTNLAEREANGVKNLSINAEA